MLVLQGEQVVILLFPLFTFGVVPVFSEKEVRQFFTYCFLWISTNDVSSVSPLLVDTKHSCFTSPLSRRCVFGNSLMHLLWCNVTRLHCVVKEKATESNRHNNVMRWSNRNFNNPPLPSEQGPSTFEDRIVQIPGPSGQNGFQMSYPNVGFVCQMVFLKNNCCRLLSSLIKLVYI